MARRHSFASHAAVVPLVMVMETIMKLAPATERLIMIQPTFQSLLVTLANGFFWPELTTARIGICIAMERRLRRLQASTGRSTLRTGGLLELAARPRPGLVYISGAQSTSPRFSIRRCRHQISIHFTTPPRFHP